MRLRFCKLLNYLILLLGIASAALFTRSALDSRSDGNKPASGDLTRDVVSPLQLRQLNEYDLLNIIIVSDIDGNLHGLDRTTGGFLWTLPLDDPLVKIRESFSMEDVLANERNIQWFVEPYRDGSLYYFTPEYGLNKLPTSIKNLVMESPFTMNNDSNIYTGLRKTSLFTIDVNTGEVINKYGSLYDDESCPVSNVYDRPMHKSRSPHGTLQLGKTTYELTIYSKLNSTVVWNVTYSHWGPNNIDADLAAQNDHSVDDLYLTPFFENSLLALSKSLGAPAWVCRLPSLAVNMFDVFQKNGNHNEYVSLPHPLQKLNDLQRLSNLDKSNDDTCFVNKTANSNEWFAMSYANFPTLLKSAPMAPYQVALQKYEDGILDQETANELRNFSLRNETAAVFFVSGVHRLERLSYANLYRPSAKFTPRNFKQIEGGLSSVFEPLPSSCPSGAAVPKFMDGIVFPESTTANSPKRNQAGGSDYPQEQSFNTNLPVKYEDPLNVLYPNSSRQPISVFRRIAEDLLVMSTLIFFFFALRKLGHLLRGGHKAKLHHGIERSEITISKEDTATNETDSNASSVNTTPFSQVKTNENNDVVLSDSEAFDSEDLSNTKSIAVSPHILDIISGDDTLDNPDQTINSKKKRKRGARGGKRSSKSRKFINENEESLLNTPMINDDGEKEDNFESLIPTTSLVKQRSKILKQSKKLQIDNNLIISDRILGYGSHGTVVYEGTFENRPVAVKRMLLEFYDVANHEVRLLQESDDHPNVIRYFCSQSSEKEKFLYIALELCVCSLEEIIEKPQLYPGFLRMKKNTHNDVLLQLVSGLNYLHSLKIVHRDLKPQNILVGEESRKKGNDQARLIRLLISDFGLCKKLDFGQSSFRATVQNAASGTSGWRAPELLLQHDLVEISPDTISPVTSNTTQSNEKRVEKGIEKRLTKAIDIFSLGCVFFYILSGGRHPFGDRYLREGNIIKGEYNLMGMEKYCPEDYVEAKHLVCTMIDSNPKLRPSTVSILKHPFFWGVNKKLEFLLKVSDRFEIERRDPPSEKLLYLESKGFAIHQGDWLSKFDTKFIENLGKYRKYKTEKVMDLLRALRNKYHHYNDMPSDLQLDMSPLPQGFYNYFSSKFPSLLMEIYFVVRTLYRDEHIFHEFF